MRSGLCFGEVLAARDHAQHREEAVAQARRWDRTRLGVASAASSPSTTASASPVGVSQLISATATPSSVKKTSARATPCHEGADAVHIARCTGLRPSVSSTRRGSSISSSTAAWHAAATCSAARRACAHRAPSRTTGSARNRGCPSIHGSRSTPLATMRSAKAS